MFCREKYTLILNIFWHDPRWPIFFSRIWEIFDKDQYAVSLVAARIYL